MYVKYKGKKIDTENAEVEELLEDYTLDFSHKRNTFSIHLPNEMVAGVWESNNKLSLAFKVSVRMD